MRVAAKHVKKVRGHLRVAAKQVRMAAMQRKEVRENLGVAAAQGKEEGGVIEGGSRENKGGG